MVTAVNNEQIFVWQLLASHSAFLRELVFHPSAQTAFVEKDEIRALLKTSAWEARQVLTWNQSWEIKLVCEMNIFTFRNPIPTGASTWPLLVSAVQASYLLSDQGASGKLLLSSSGNWHASPNRPNSSSWTRTFQLYISMGATPVNNFTKRSPIRAIMCIGSVTSSRLRRSMVACQRPANLSHQSISPWLVTRCCWRHSPLLFHKQHHTGVAGTAVFLLVVEGFPPLHGEKWAQSPSVGDEWWLEISSDLCRPFFLKWGGMFRVVGTCCTLGMHFDQGCSGTSVVLRSLEYPTSTSLSA